MNAALIISISSAIFFGLIAIAVSLRKDRKEKSLGRSTGSSRYSSVEEEFVHMMVHELRAPLTSVKDASELLITSSTSLTEEEKGQFLKIINRQSKALLEQISEILDAAKFESGAFVLEKKNENVQELISERIKMFEPQAAKKQISISSHIDPLPLVYLDCLRIDQVLNNLISNSIKFTPPGGKVAIEAKLAGENVEISVSDTGIGIDKDVQGKIFSKFYQARSPLRQEEGSGTGLGLYIVKKIIDAHKGTIALESAGGKGTVMKFSLPIQEQVQVKEDNPLSAQYTMPN
ncbi:MAG: HAMP domain-containing sensor histidine kinase [Patescibacteria group bacterium]